MFPGPQPRSDVITEISAEFGQRCHRGSGLIACWENPLRNRPGPCGARPSVPARRSSPSPQLSKKALLALVACNRRGAAAVRMTPSTHQKPPSQWRGA